MILGPRATRHGHAIYSDRGVVVGGILFVRRCWVRGRVAKLSDLFRLG
jgi:hypothetical protein